MLNYFYLQYFGSSSHYIFAFYFLQLKGVNTRKRSSIKMDFDDVLRKIGQFGKYQKIMLACVYFVGIPTAFNNMVTVFLTAIPNHWCASPDLEKFNLSWDQIWNLTLPLETKDGDLVYRRCRMYDRNYSAWSLDTVQEELAKSQRDNTSTKACNNDWIYDDSVYKTTIVTDWDLVCDRSILATTASSVYMAGLMVGVLSFGMISDFLGRKKAISITLFLMMGFNIGTAFAPNYETFVILRFLVALTTISVFTTGFVYGVELVGPDWRVFAGIFIEFYWAVGYMIVAGVAYGLRDWRKLQLALSVSLVVFLLIIPIIPESPRWLFVKGRKEEGEKLIRKIAKFNKVELPDKLDIVVKTSVTEANITHLVRSRRLFLRSLNVCFNWFVNSLVYYGLSLNTSNLGGNDYVNFFIAAAVEIPAYILCLILLPVAGRRWPISVTMVVGGVALLCTMAVPKHLNVIAIVLAMIGKFTITMSFGIIYVFTAELYPTVLRNTAVGSGSLFARVGGVVAPYIADLSKFSRFIPLVVFGIASIVAGLLILILPETKGKLLPETLEDGENFGLPTSPKEGQIASFEMDAEASSKNVKEEKPIPVLHSNKGFECEPTRL